MNTIVKDPLKQITLQEALQAEPIGVRAICWNCGAKLHKADTATLNPKTGKLFCTRVCQVRYEE